MKKIVLIGDSIRMGYDAFVKQAFDGVACVYSPKENCRFAAYVLREIREWKNQFDCGDDVDCVHWNVGLWDCLKLMDGEVLTPIDVYARYIDRISGAIRLYFPQAKVIFATSTPVREELFGEFKRLNADVERYNAAALEVVKKHGFAVNDLYAIASKAPVEYHSDMTHYRTKEGTRMMAGAVIRALENCLNVKANELDYDALFDGPKKDVGV